MRRFKWRIKDKSEYVCRQLGDTVRNAENEVECERYEDDKIRIERRCFSDMQIWVKLPTGDEQVFSADRFMHTNYHICRYGRWVNYLWSLSEAADNAWLNQHREAKARTRHNFSDIDDAVIFGDEYAG